ncbi:MAG: YraN family protein [Candidatus Portnoybacteria bacterium]|nr:YraN family protein [Candidatus Portnoybacteria bacterium]
MPTAKRKIGDLGEDAAANYLKGRGYQILDRNYNRKWGEIDIVTRFKKDIVFVEVKSQEKGTKFFPAQNVNYFKQQRLIRAAKTWLLENRILPETPWQIDVMVVKLNSDSGASEIEHIKNAVWASR